MPELSSLETAPRVWDVRPDRTMNETCFDEFGECGAVKCQDYILCHDLLIISHHGDAPDCHHALAFQAFEQIGFRLIYPIWLRNRNLTAIEATVGCYSDDQVCHAILVQEACGLLVSVHLDQDFAGSQFLGSERLAQEAFKEFGDKKRFLGAERI